jgi:hypothetical protein
MKNSIIVVLLAFSSQCFAQWSKIQLGVEGGYNISRFRSKNVGILTDMYGFTGSSGGLSLQYKFNKTFSIKTGAYFYNRATKGEILFTNVSGNVLGKADLDVKYREFVFPIVPVIHTQLSPKGAGYIGIGPSLFFHYNKRVVIDTFDVKSKYTYFPDEGMSRTSFGLHAAIGYSYLVSKRININFEFRDVLAIIRIKNFTPDVQRIKFNSVCLIFGINYTLDFKDTAANPKPL